MRSIYIYIYIYNISSLRVNAYPVTNNEPQMWKEAVIAYFRATVAAFVDKTEDSHRNVRSGYRFPGQDLNTEPPE